VTREYEGRQVLVTGGAGFIGSHLVEELVRRRARVTVVDNLSTGHESNLEAVVDSIDFHRFDLRSDDLQSLLARRFDLVFHLAANAFSTGVDDPRQDFEDNILGTFNLLEAMRAAAPETPVLHTSSAAVYGEGVRVPIREDDPTLPVSPYGVSKLASERYVAVYVRAFALRGATLRLFSVFGPRLRKQVVYDLMRKIRENPEELFIHGDGTQVRDFNYVANVADAIILTADRARLEGEVYNVAAEEAISIGELAERLCAEMDVSPRFVYSGKRRPGEPQRWYADTSRLRELGYKPGVGLEEGLSETVAWFDQETVTASR
jgi:UDP-glucose 4-epimerase